MNAAILLAGILLAQGAVEPAGMTREMRLDPPPYELRYLTLPSGRLATLAATNTAIAFADLDHVQRSGDEIKAVIYGVYDPAKPVGPYLSSQVVMGLQFNCRQRRHIKLGMLTYDSAGTLLMWNPQDPQTATDPNSTFGAAETLLCGKTRPAAVLNGHDAAMKFALKTLRK